MTKCAICGRTDSKRWINHHVDYSKDKTIRLCFVCHEICHHRRVWGHPIFDPMGKDLGPLRFAQALVKAYKKAGVK